MSKKDVKLSDIQFTVMRALWETDCATTAEVFERVGKPRSLAYTTIATLLTRLEKRGIVRSVKRQGERVFTPTISERDAKGSMVSSLVSTIFQGDPSALVTHLVKENKISKSDREAIQKLLLKGGRPDDH